MLTREQEHALERLGIEQADHRVHIREGFVDGAAHVTTPDGATYTLDRWGDLRRAGVNFSIKGWDR